MSDRKYSYDGGLTVEPRRITTAEQQTEPHEYGRFVRTSVSVTRRLQFCAGHRVYGHESKCAHPHGHNYVAHITAIAEQLDGVGRVIDFGVLKDRIGGWIDRTWDHAFIAYIQDTTMCQFLLDNQFHAYLMPSNPTAENMAAELLSIANHLLEGTGVRVTRVDLEETENCRASYTEEEFRQ